MSWKHWCSSLALCVLAGHAHALPLAQADFTEFQIALVDLDPDDGIDPSIHWSDIRTDVAVFEFERVDNSDNSRSADWGEHAVSIDGGSATSTATDLHGELSRLGYHSSSGRWGDFTLSAHTQLVVTGLVTLSVEGNPPYVQLAASLTLYAFPPRQYSHDEAGLLPGSQTTQKSMIATFKNEGGVPLNGSFSMGAYAATATPTPAVPEPQAWLMAACGLGLVGAVARRRRTAINNPAGVRTRTRWSSCFGAGCSKSI